MFSSCQRVVSKSVKLSASFPGTSLTGSNSSCTCRHFKYTRIDTHCKKYTFGSKFIFTQNPKFLVPSRSMESLSSIADSESQLGLGGSQLVFEESQLSIGDGDVSDVSLEQPAKLAVEIFHKALESVKPGNLLKNKVHLSPEGVLNIDDEAGTSLDLNSFRKIFVIGFGKAALPMVESMYEIIGDRVERYVVSIPVGFRDSEIDKIEIHRGAQNNIPDEAAFKSAKKIVDLVQSCVPSDLLIVLITGGGSALLPYPQLPITIEEKSELIKKLSKQGASITELNSVRKRLSLVKGGGLLNLCKASRVLSLILSDVPGDPIDVIASGPTINNPDPSSLAKEIVEKYITLSALPSSIEKVLNEEDPIRNIPGSSDQLIDNIIIGNNTLALETGAEMARTLGLYPFILTNTLSGEAYDVGGELGHITQGISFLLNRPKTDIHYYAYERVIRFSSYKLNLDSVKIDNLIDKVANDEDLRRNYSGVCVLLGGETTVKVIGDGVGGRNQEIALSAGIRLDTMAHNDHVAGKVALLSGGTDGFDGPCEAAGAVVDSSTICNGYTKRLSPFDHLVQNNSYRYFKKNSHGIYHIITGHTETNVMDLVIMVAIK